MGNGGIEETGSTRSIAAGTAPAVFSSKTGFAFRRHTVPCAGIAVYV